MKYTDPAHVKEAKITEVPAHGQTISGYGSQLPTQYMIKYLGRWRRVYMMQYANSGSAYVIVQHDSMFLDSDTEHRLEKLNELREFSKAIQKEQ